MKDQIKKELDRIPEYRRIDQGITESMVEFNNVVKFLKSVQSNDMTLVLQSRSKNDKVEIRADHIIDELVKILADYVENYNEDDFPDRRRGGQEGLTIETEIYQYCARCLYLEYMKKNESIRGVYDYIIQEFTEAGHPKSRESIKGYLRNWDPKSG